MKEAEKMKKLSTNIEEIIKNIKQATGESPDIVYRKLKFMKKHTVYLVYSQALGEANKINDFILKSISSDIKRSDVASFKNVFELLKNTIPNVSLNTVNNYNDLFFFLYSGFSLVIIDGYNEIIVFESKAPLDRGIQETTAEPIISGPKEGLTEDFYKNIGLIRKRIRDKSLWLKEYIIGNKSNTRVGLLYINGLADERLITYLKNKLDSINIDGIVDASQIVELITKVTRSTFPITFRTERPDLTATLLLKGKIAITVDNSPVVIIIPTNFIDFLHTSDDHYQKPIHVFAIRIIRILCFLTSIMVPGYYIALISFEKGIIPPPLLVNIKAQRSIVPFPLGIEILLLSFIFEIIRESDIRSPSNVGGAISILGALILGQAAVAAGLVSTIAVIVVAFSAMAGLIFQSKEFNNTIRLWRFIFIIFASAFGIVGMFICGLLLSIHLCSLKSFGKPYLMPLAPIDKKELDDAVIRKPISKKMNRQTNINKNAVN